MSFKFDIIRYLEEHRITMAAAAKAADMAPQNIKKCLSGNPKIKNILAVANGLGIDPREFFYMENSQTPSSTSTGTLVAPEGLAEAHTLTLPEAQPVQTTAFCPHCGAKVRVGVLLMPE